MKISNKDLIQSYIITSAKYDYTAYEKRILYRIVEMLQNIIQGKKLNQKINVEKDLFGTSIVTMPISIFLNNEDDKNHSRIKKAVENLEKKKFIYEDDETWEIIRILSEPKINKYKEYLTFRLNPKIIDAFLDFSKGFSKFELATAMEFESHYTMRFYELLSGQKKPITYKVDNLKIMFKIENKYKARPSDFIKRVVIPAKKELDEKSPYSFSYKTIKMGRKIISIKFFPVYQSKNRDLKLEGEKLQKNISLRWDLDVIIINYLKENYIFSKDEIKNNIDLFKRAQNSTELDLLYFLSEQKRNAETKKNPKGWIINALKNQLEHNRESFS